MFSSLWLIPAGRDVVFRDCGVNGSLVHSNSLTSPGFFYYLSWPFRHIVHGLRVPP